MIRSRPLAVALALTAAACSAPPYPDPRQTDEALEAGAILPLPVTGDWPRLGLQWTYRVVAEGFSAAEEFPPRIAYRLTAQDEMGHPWSGWWMYGADRAMEFTGATIEVDDVFFHPPRELGFSQLQFAPFPEAVPGHPSVKEGVLTLGEGHGEREGQSVFTTHTNVGRASVAAPAGKFDDAWRVEANSKPVEGSPGWTARFWWVPRVGWVRLEWARGDGARLEMLLTGVRQVRRDE